MISFNEARGTAVPRQGQSDIEDALRNYTFFPLIQLGVSFRF